MFLGCFTLDILLNWLENTNLKSINVALHLHIILATSLSMAFISTPSTTLKRPLADPFLQRRNDRKYRFNIQISFPTTVRCNRKYSVSMAILNPNKLYSNGQNFLNASFSQRKIPQLTRTAAKSAKWMCDK